MNTEEKEIVIRQIKCIQKRGAVNMCDIVSVSRIAKQIGFEQLYTVLQNHESAYVGFILSGDDSAFDSVTLGEDRR